jgi:hypothetical protein
MITIKLSVREANDIFPIDHDNGQPFGTVDLPSIEKLWREVDGNSGPYPAVLEFMDIVIHNPYDTPQYVDEFGDDCLEVAAALIKFVDGTSEEVKFVCVE